MVTGAARGHRRRDRPHAGARRRHVVGRRRPGRRGRARGRHERGAAARPSSSTSPARRRGRASLGSRTSAARRPRRRGPQRRDPAGQAARQHDAGAVGRVLAVNLEAPLRITETLAERPRWPRAVAAPHRARLHLAGSRATAARPTTAPSKAGVIGMTRALAPALAEVGGTVNAVAPGFIETEMTAADPAGHPAGGASAQLAAAGRAAGRRRRGHRVPRLAAGRRRQRRRCCASAARTWWASDLDAARHGGRLAGLPRVELSACPPWHGPTAGRSRAPLVRAPPPVPAHAVGTDRGAPATVR